MRAVFNSMGISAGITSIEECQDQDSAYPCPPSCVWWGPHPPEERTFRAQFELPITCPTFIGPMHRRDGLALGHSRRSGEALRTAAAVKTRRSKAVASCRS